MKIKGLQKVTLIDYPDKLACTIFLFGCNFRCGFCHNPELVLNNEGVDLSEKEILNFLEKRKKYLDGVCITGGEPLMTLEKDFLKKIKALGYFVKLDTNGSFPELLKEFIETGLVDYVAMDIKSSRDKYAWVTGSGIDVENIEESIRVIVNSGLDYEFRTTIVEGIHDEKEIAEIGVWMNEVVGEDFKIKKYILQGFKNKGKFIDNSYKLKKDISEDFLKSLKEVADNYFEDVEIRV